MAQWGLFLGQLLSKAERMCVGLVGLVRYAKVLTDLAPCEIARSSCNRGDMTGAGQHARAPGGY